MKPNRKGATLFRKNFKMKLIYFFISKMKLICYFITTPDIAFQLMFSLTKRLLKYSNRVNQDWNIIS